VEGKLYECLRKMGRLGYEPKREVVSTVTRMNGEVIQGRIKTANETFIVVKNIDDGEDEIIFCHAIAKIK